jgi:flavin reductase (DIM6/NTAB) family NADH-FMN oxidoreductase RutF
MTVDMEQFVDASKANLREGVEFTFDKATNTWKAIEATAALSISFLDKKWDSLKLRFSRLRCRVRGGVKEFFDASQQQWVQFTADMDGFVSASKQNLKEGVEWTWDLASDSWVAAKQSVSVAINWADARWASLRARFATVRCRVKGGVREFFDERQQQWTRFSADLSTFADATKASFTEGKEWVFDASTNAWRSVEARASATINFLDAKWASLRKRFSGVRCRVRSGAREFFDTSAQQWTRMTIDMEQFVDASKVVALPIVLGLNF